MISSFFNGCKSIKENKIDSECSYSIEKFFSQIGKFKYIAALDSLLLSNTNIDFTDSATIRLRDGFKSMNQLSGKYLGYRLLKKRIVGDDIAIYSYLVKYEKKYYRFTFIYYKPAEKINIYKFSYDDELNLELEESLKLYTQ